MLVTDADPSLICLIYLGRALTFYKENTRLLVNARDIMCANAARSLFPKGYVRGEQVYIGFNVIQERVDWLEPSRPTVDVRDYIRRVGEVFPDPFGSRTPRTDQFPACRSVELREVVEVGGHAIECVPSRQLIKVNDLNAAFEYSRPQSLRIILSSLRITTVQLSGFGQSPGLYVELADVRAWVLHGNHRHACRARFKRYRAILNELESRWPAETILLTPEVRLRKFRAEDCRTAPCGWWKQPGHYICSSI